MTKNNEHKNIPELRFPEFRDDGEWEKKRLGEVAEFLKGKGISKSDIEENGLLPCIRYGQLYTTYKEIINDAISYTNISAKELVLSRINDVIIPSSGETHEDIATASCVMKEGVALGGDLNIIRSDINGVFLSYYLNHAKKHEIAHMAQGISVVHLYSNQLKNLKIEFPLELEQRKIANCLSSLDELITAHSDKLKVLKDHKKGLMQVLFPQEGERVPRYRFKEFENGEEWDLRHFSNYIVLFRGSSPRPIQEYLTKSGTGVNWIKIGDTKQANNFILTKTEERITTEGSLKSRKVHKGELILANSMSFGKTYLLEIEGYIYDGWFVLRNYEKHFDKRFLLQLLNSRYMQVQYEKLSAGGIVQNISSDIVYNTILPHTALKEQQKLADTLSSLDELIASQSEKIKQLKIYKKGLMQKLFPAINE